jgi:hypothetical protein
MRLLREAISLASHCVNFHCVKFHCVNFHCVNFHCGSVGVRPPKRKTGV